MDEPEQVEAFPSSPEVWVVCQGCRSHRRLSTLVSKYGKPQLVGHIKGDALYEARCASCDTGVTKGMESIWREQS